MKQDIFSKFILQNFVQMWKEPMIILVSLDKNVSFLCFLEDFLLRIKKYKKFGLFKS